MAIPFLKIHGCGNSFILINHKAAASVGDIGKFSQRVCSVGFGVGSDGLMVVGDLEEEQGRLLCRVGMYNPDGSWMGMCGNGTRCVVKYLFATGAINGEEAQLEILVGDRLVHCSTQDAGSTVSVNMGAPLLNPASIPASCEHEVVDHELEVAGRSFRVTAVSMGNPHCVIFEAEPDYKYWGSLIEVHPFFPERANVEFVEVVGPGELRVVVWERGAGATLACGTGACAVVVAATTLGYVEGAARVLLPGGALDVRWERDDNSVWLEGPTALVCSGELS